MLNRGLSYQLKSNIEIWIPGEMACQFLHNFTLSFNLLLSGDAQLSKTMVIDIN